MAARRCVPSQSRHFDQSLGTDRRPPFWNSARRLPETVPAGKGSPTPSPRVLQMKSPSLCFWLFSSSLLLCDPFCAYFASDLRLEPSDAGGALGLVGAKRESAPFIPTSWCLLDAQKEFSLIRCVPLVGQGWARRAHLRVPPETSQRRSTV